MDYLSRIKSTVVDTVSNLSSVLTGNPLSGQYEIGNYLGCYGPGLHWKMYHAIKRSTREEACVFLLEKKSLDRYSKSERDYLLSFLKQGVGQLTRLRHPALLTVSHSLEESREAFAFATEACFCSLANVLKSDRPASPSTDLPEAAKDYKLHEIEIKYGLTQVAEGLAFLHQAKRVHGNICPEMIVIDKKGGWKLAGFDLCVTLSGDKARYDFDSTAPQPCQPNYDFVAPECVNDLTCSPSSDMYSLGILVFSVHMNGSTPYSTRNNLQTLKTCLAQMKDWPKSKLQNLPKGAQGHVRLLLNCSPALRPDAHEFLKLPYLEDAAVKTLRDLDNLYQLDKVAKSHIYKGLPPIIEKLPKRMSLYRVLPCLAAEYVNPEMIPFILPSVLLIVEIGSKEEFTALILPGLQRVFTYTEPVHIMYLLLQKMDLLIQKCPPEAIPHHLLPIVYRSLECNSQQIQELCLVTIPDICQLIEYSSMKNSLLPKVKKLCIVTSLTSTRVKCLVCLGRILEHLDKWVALDDVIAWLPDVKSRDSAVLMAIVGIYKVALNSPKLGITKEILACKVIPFLVPLVIEASLNLSQFNQVVTLIREMLSQVENEHRTKLEQTDTSRDEQVNSNLGSAVNSPNADELLAELTLDNISTNKPKTMGTETLSLEHKQRLAQQGDAMKLLANQPPLIPNSRLQGKPQTESRSGAQNTRSNAKDLTSSLMISNMISFQNKTNNLKPKQQAQQQEQQQQQRSFQPNYNIDTQSLMSPASGPNNWSKNDSWLVTNNSPSIKRNSTNWDDSWGDWSTPVEAKSSLDLSEFDTLEGLGSKKTDILKRNKN